MTLAEIERLTPEEQLQLFDTLGRDSCLFSRIVMGHVVRDVPDMHRDIYKILDDSTGPNPRYNYVAMVLFRGAAKSTIKTFKQVHDIVYRHEPVSLFLSEAEDQSIRDLIAVQDEIESNEVLNALYGPLKGSNLWNRTECEFANGVYVAAKGWRSKIRGLKWKMQRPTKLWLDDFEGETNSKTVDARRGVKEWIDRQVLPAGDTHPKTIFLGTIVHPDAYLAKIKDLDMFTGKGGVYYERAIAGAMDGANPAWASRYPTEWILAKKRYYEQSGEMASFMQEYFNIPAELSDPKFNTDMVQEVSGGTFDTYLTETYIKTDTGRAIPVNVFVGVDVASTTNARSDRTVITTIGVLPNGNAVILDIFAEKISVLEQVNKVFEIVDRYKPKHVTVETYGYQRSLKEWLEDKMTERQNYFAIEPFNENKSKSKKYIEGLEPFINDGRIGYMEGCKNIQLFFEEARNFSGGIRDHDDTLDGLFLALNKSYAPPEGYDVAARIESMKKALKSKDKKKKLTWVTI